MFIPIFPNEPRDTSFISALQPPSTWKRPTPKQWITASQQSKRPGCTRRESVNVLR